jgi:hypothetical protein
MVAKRRGTLSVEQGEVEYALTKAGRKQQTVRDEELAEEFECPARERATARRAPPPDLTPLGSAMRGS